MFPMTDDSTALLAAAQNGHDTCVRILIEAGADVHPVKSESTWRVVLSHGTSSRHASCVELLIQAGVEVNNDVFNSSKYKDLDLYKSLEVFVRAGADVKSIEGANALENACRKGYDKCLDVLLKAGADVNIHNKDGQMALGVTARGWRGGEEREKCLNVFIAAGVDVNRRDKYGYTALLYAAEKGLDTCVN